MNNLKTEHILGWTLFCMIMPLIPVAGTFCWAWAHPFKHEDFLVLIIFLVSYAGLLAIPLSLLNFFLFKKNMSIRAAKRIATIPLGVSIVCSGILFLFGCSAFMDGFEAVIILAAAAMHSFIAIKAIYWFRNKIEEIYNAVKDGTPITIQP